MILRNVYEKLILIDSSAVIALHSDKDKLHPFAKEFYIAQNDKYFIALNCTSHESYTRARYLSNFKSAWNHYQFLKNNNNIQIVRFLKSDENEAEKLLKKYKEHKISFHDALCAAVMFRLQIFKIFSFDKHFHILGFEVLPGITK